MKFLRRHIAYILGFFLSEVAVTACGSKDETDHHSIEEEVVAEVGDSVLMFADVERRIPYGITPEDSTALFNAIVDSWIERLLLESFGTENIDDMENIERMVEDYRKKLIVASYRRTLRASHRWSVSEDSVRGYYDKHTEDFILGRPVIKGLYVKIPSDFSRLSDVRRWMQTATPDAIDNLERFGLSDAAEYSFFQDKWTDWNMLSRKIPYRFGEADLFVASRKNFEVAHGGMTYLLHISDFLPSGRQMPYEVAAPIIAEIMEGDAGENYERRLISSLYSKARKDGILRDYRNRQQISNTK